MSKDQGASDELEPVKLSGVRGDESFKVYNRDFKFRGKIVNVSVDHIRFPGGYETHHEVLHLPSAVCVVPLLEGPGGRKEVVLLEQFRSSLRGYIHEIPAGILEPGEDPAACAGRELEEETGYTARRITHLTTLFPIPGTSAHTMWFYLAEELLPGSQRLEEAECLTVKTYPLADLLEALQGKKPPVIVDAKTHVGILHTHLRLLQAFGAGAR